MVDIQGVCVVCGSDSGPRNDRGELLCLACYETVKKLDTVAGYAVDLQRYYERTRDRRVWPNESVAIRVIIYKEDNDTLYAHCLEFDSVGDGKTPGQAVASLVTGIKEKAAEEEMTLFDPAETPVWRMFASGEPCEQGEAFGDKLKGRYGKLEVTGAEVRVYGAI